MIFLERFCDFLIKSQSFSSLLSQCCDFQKWFSSSIFLLVFHPASELLPGYIIPNLPLKNH